MKNQISYIFLGLCLYLTGAVGLVHIGSNSAVAQQFVGRQISVDLQHTDIDNFLRIIAEVADKNVTMMENLNGKVTKRLIDNPWDQVLSIVLAEKDLMHFYDGEVILVYRRGSKIGEDRKAKRLLYFGKRQSIDLYDGDPRDTLRRLIKDLGKQAEGAEAINCRVTLRLIDVPSDQILSLLLERCGLRHHETVTSIVISSISRKIKDASH